MDNVFYRWRRQDVNLAKYKLHPTSIMCSETGLIEMPHCDGFWIKRDEVLEAIVLLENQLVIAKTQKHERRKKKLLKIKDLKQEITKLKTQQIHECSVLCCCELCELNEKRRISLLHRYWQLKPLRKYGQCCYCGRIVRKCSEQLRFTKEEMAEAQKRLIKS
jgi:hypothetical protein